MTVICYPKCSTCVKAEKWLKEQGIEYSYRPIKEEKPTEKELTEWIRESGLPISRFFNTSGLLYREHNIKDKLKVLSQAELIKILASDGMFVKRPVVLRNGKFILNGFKEGEWERELK
ncbi:arsenate reductase family protein [Paludibacter sp. 221]|nr:arsenate reductase family protein [Paludibacter sp. 221]